MWIVIIYWLINCSAEGWRPVRGRWQDEAEPPQQEPSPLPRRQQQVHATFHNLSILSVKMYPTGRPPVHPCLNTKFITFRFYSNALKYLLLLTGCCILFLKSFLSGEILFFLSWSFIPHISVLLEFPTTWYSSPSPFLKSSSKFPSPSPPPHLIFFPTALILKGRWYCFFSLISRLYSRMVKNLL